MPRVKRGTHRVKRRKKYLSATKGYMWGRKSKITLMKTAMLKAGAHAYADRRRKKREFRSLWNIRINAASREDGLTYSRLIAGLHKKGIAVDRKILAALALQYPAVFSKVVSAAK